MKETSLKPVIEKLESLFSKFNEKFFEVLMQFGSFHTMNRHIENMEYENGMKRKE